MDHGGHDHQHVAPEVDFGWSGSGTANDRPFRIGVGGPVGSGKSLLVERLVPLMIERGFSPGVIANDVMTIEDQHILRRGLHGILDADRIVGVETGTCPHTAVREDPTLNLAAVERMTSAPDNDPVSHIFVGSEGAMAPIMSA